MVADNWSEVIAEVLACSACTASEGSRTWVHSKACRSFDRIEVVRRLRSSVYLLDTCQSCHFPVRNLAWKFQRGWDEDLQGKFENERGV